MLALWASGSITPVAQEVQVHGMRDKRLFHKVGIHRRPAPETTGYCLIYHQFLLSFYADSTVFVPVRKPSCDGDWMSNSARFLRKRFLLSRKSGDG
jgi:hypothetical protein